MFNFKALDVYFPIKNLIQNFFMVQEILVKWWENFIFQHHFMLGSKTLGTKCIRISMCNVLANHDQNLEFRFRLLKMCLCVKLESSDCRIYWTKFVRLNRSKIRLGRSNFVQIVFSAEFPTQPKPKWCVGFYVLLKV